MSEDSVKDYRALEVVSLLSSRSGISFTIKNLTTFNHNLTTSMRKVSAAIIIIGSREDLTALNIKRESFNHDGFFLIILLDDDVDDMKTIFKAFWEIYIYNVNIIAEAADGQVSMLTFLPFINKLLCNDLTPTTINKFDGQSMEWQTAVSFPEKFKNFNRCPIKIGEFVFYGFEVDLFENVAEHLNFSIDKANGTEIGVLFENGTATGIFNLLLKGEIDVFVAVLSLQSMRLELFSSTISFFDDSIILLIPPRLALAPLAKLIYPFQTQAWLLILSLLVLSYAMIFFVELSPKHIRDFVIGKSVKTPYENILIAFVGSSQKTLPKGSFARFLLTMLLLFCLVVRTMYSGKLFFAMSSNIYSKELTSIYDFYDEHYEFYMHRGFAGRLAFSRFFNS